METFNELLKKIQEGVFEIEEFGNFYTISGDFSIMDKVEREKYFLINNMTKT